MPYKKSRMTFVATAWIVANQEVTTTLQEKRFSRWNVRKIALKHEVK